MAYSISSSLLIDTSTEQGFIAAIRNDNLLFHASLGGTFDSAQAVIPLLEKQLSENALQLSDMEAITVSIGPGSYTGIRIGVIIAKSLAYALKKPLIGVPSVELFAPHSTEISSFAVLLDAKMGGVYCAFGNHQDGKIIFEPAFTVAIDQLPTTLNGVQLIVSPHTAKLRERSPFLRQLFWQDALPNPQLLWQNGKYRWQKGEFSTDATVNILYLRRSQAEIERDAKENS